MRSSWAAAELARLEPVLRPAWWVVRPYLPISLLAALEHDRSYPGFPVPRLLGNPAIGLLAVVLAIPVSVRLAQRPLPRAGRLAMVGANVVLAFYAMTLLGRAGTPDVHYIVEPSGPLDNRGCLATASGQRITNLYAYDADGRVLDPVMLYDQNGQPIDNLCPDYDERGRRLTTEYRQDVNGAPVINAFPRRQVASLEREPRLGVTGPTEPVKPPAVVVPRLVTTTTTTAPPGG